MSIIYYDLPNYILLCSTLTKHHLILAYTSRRLLPYTKLKHLIIFVKLDYFNHQRKVISVY